MNELSEKTDQNLAEPNVQEKEKKAESTEQKNRWLSFWVDGMLSGLMIGVGGIVNLSCENRYLGAFLFSLGLFSIIQFRYGLYTGKVGYIVNRDKAYIGETFFTLLANAVGAAVTAGLIYLTRFAQNATVSGLDVTLVDRAQASMQTKLDDSLLSSLILAFFCGLMMFTAVEGHRCCATKRNFVGGLFLVVMPIMVFILSGFNHCVADIFYFFLAGCPNVSRALLYFLMVIVGNALGGMLIPFLKKFSNQPL